VKQVHVSEDIRKLAHVDAMFTLNQTPEEKRIGLIRMGIAAHRHRESNLFNEVYITQNLAMSQPLIDSMIEVHI
jgi:hypothetical protein